MTKSQIKINRRGLAELVLACAFLSLSTFALWSWYNHGGYVAAAGNAVPGAEMPLLPQISRHPAIMLSTVLSEFVLLLAIMLAVVPLSWWLRADALMPADGAPASSPLNWLARKLQSAPPAPGDPPGGSTVNEAGETVFVPLPGVDGVVEPKIIMVEQPDGSLLAMVQQEDGTLTPADDVIAGTGERVGENRAGRSTDALFLFPASPENAMDFEDEEENPLADLADIGDILSLAFEDDNPIDPEREAIGRSLDEVDILSLAEHARHVLATLRQ